MKTEVEILKSEPKVWGSIKEYKVVIVNVSININTK